ncbi:hypothetical protein GOP47_0022587 [Adiantum capillus-veneris]|uniref:DET1- and DDB1-associated protein 1 domain-containing protein n=1 Tax=Adiantum capillus-veneris TaxID=13818 RepID=A0A9D4Z4E5_ADICA|nr:hypothetical protein GOP47_0022587 [Adiantum capillus-veneris]
MHYDASLHLNSNALRNQDSILRTTRTRSIEVGFLHDPALGLLMGSLFGDWPSYNPHNFSQLRPSDPSHPLQLTPATYYATHNRTIPPAHQVISTEVNNILLRHFHQSSEEKVNSKRPAQESPAAEHASKQLKSSSDRRGCGEDGLSAEVSGDGLSMCIQFFQIKCCVSPIGSLVCLEEGDDTTPKSQISCPPAP